MSLLKQLLISMTLAIVVILSGVMIFSIDSARQYLDTQLQAQADSTATSLALTLSQPSNQEPSVRELLISVLFDSGEFRVMEFLDPTGRILVRRQLNNDAGGSGAAPAWFSHLLPLDRHEAQRQVSGGWSQLGVVRLQANDAYARDALWSGSVRIVSLTVAAGLLSDRWIARGGSPTRVRKAFLITSAVGTAVTIGASAVVAPAVTVWLLGAAGLFFGLSTSNGFAVTATLAGPHAAGRWAGAQNVAGQLAGVLSPLVTGFVVDRTGRFAVAFAIAAAFALLAAVGWGVVIRRVAEVAWVDNPQT